MSFLCYVSARSLFFLHPRKMFNSDVCVERLKQYMSIFFQVRHLKESEADKIRRQYAKFIHLYMDGNPGFKIPIFLKTESMNFSQKKLQDQGFLICRCDFASAGTWFRRKRVFN